MERNKGVSVYSGMMTSTNIKKQVEEIEKKRQGIGIENVMKQVHYDNYKLYSSIDECIMNFKK